MKKLDIAAYHPIPIYSIQYVHFSFDRLTANIEPPLQFPEFDVTIVESLVIDSTTGRLVMHVASKPQVEEEPDTTPPVLAFTCTVLVLFRCAEFEGHHEHLKAFMEAETPSLITWPYVRGFVSDMVHRSGLPEFHLPLLQIYPGVDAHPGTAQHEMTPGEQ